MCVRVCERRNNQWWTAHHGKLLVTFSRFQFTTLPLDSPLIDTRHLITFLEGITSQTPNEGRWTKDAMYALATAKQTTLFNIVFRFIWNRFWISLSEIRIFLGTYEYKAILTVYSFSLIVRQLNSSIIDSTLTLYTVNRVQRDNSSIKLAAPFRPNNYGIDYTPE